MNLREVRFTGFDAFGFLMIGYGVPVSVYTFPGPGLGIDAFDGQLFLFVAHSVAFTIGLGMLALGRYYRRKRVR